MNASTRPEMAFPLAFGHWLVSNDELVCRLPRKTVTVSAPGELLSAVLELCNGRTSWKAVAAELCRTWQADAVQPFLSDLKDGGLLVEAGSALAHWTDLGQLPAAFPSAAGPDDLYTLHRVGERRLLPGKGLLSSSVAAGNDALTGMLRRRKTSRTFDDLPLDSAVLASICWAAHGVVGVPDGGGAGWRRTIASGGSMHSARWFVAVLRDLPAAQGALGAGLYEVRFHTEGGVSFQELRGDSSAAWRLVDDPRALRFASALLLPVFDIAVPARKYGNRASIFAGLEAGQALQNAQLMAGSLGGASMVCGSTVSSAVIETFRGALGDSAVGNSCWLSLPALLVGAAPSSGQLAQQRSSQWAHFANAGKPDEGLGFAFSAGPIELGDRRIYAGGRAQVPSLAVLKAEAEAWERLAWATPVVTVRARMADLDGALDPRSLVSYRPAQYAKTGFPYHRFAVAREYSWVQGVEVEAGRMAALPAECIYAADALPTEVVETALTSMSTSGMAAWTDAEGALCRATLELVERHCFLRAWLGQRSPAQINVDSLPSTLKMRVYALLAQGLLVSVSEVGGNLAPVFTIFAQSESRPFTAITAAADFDIEAALSKALDEMEGRVAVAMTHPEKPITRLDQVRGIRGIDRYYQTAGRYRRSDFFGQGESVVPFSSAGHDTSTSWNMLKERLRADGHVLHAFDLTPPAAAVDQGRRPLHVIRAVVPGLIPIWFGYGTEPAGLSSFRRACGPGLLTDRSADFIHPFT